jgi:putative ABC transport system permease protein
MAIRNPQSAIKRGSMERLLQDLRYSVRMLLKNPVFTSIAVLTLALGIGANTAIGTVVNAALLRGLPYEEPDRLVQLWELTPQKDFPRREASHPDYLDWSNNQSIELTAYTGGGSLSLMGRDMPERIPSAGVKANFFDVLGVKALHGRTFLAQEDVASGERVVVLSYGVWQRLFNGDVGIINQSINLNGDPYTVVGILPRNFQFARRGDVELWTPMRPGPNQLSRRFMHWVNVIGRLKPGVSFEQAQAEMKAIGQRIEEQHHDSHANTTITLIPLQEQIVGSVKPVLFVLLGAVAFVLLIACANVANLLLARSTARQREIAIRVALGASRGRLVRQFLTESLLLALIGGALGVVLAHWGVAALVAGIPDFQLNSMPYLRDLKIDSSIVLFTFGLSLVTGIIFGLIPALQASNPQLHATIKEGGQSSVGIGRRRLRSTIVVAEIALALVLLVGAGLMMKSLTNLLKVTPGFQTENLLTFNVSLLPAKYQDDHKIANINTQMIEHIESLPGVQGAGVVDSQLLMGGNTTFVYIEGKPKPAPGEETEVNIRDISANYFQTLGVPLLQGRYFRDSDKNPNLIIINKTLADLLLPGENAVGKRIIYPSVTPQPVEIIGVVADEKVTPLDVKQTGVVYEPFQEFPSMFSVFVVRTTTDPKLLSNAIREEIRQLDSEASIFGVRTIEEVIDNSPSTFLRRYPAFLTGIFATVALILASIGIYGVISYSVTQQTRDIGIRMALGAQSVDVLKMVIGQGMKLAVAGVTLGLIAAFALTRLIESLLFGVSATDITTFIGISLLLTTVTLLACYIPARRATKVDPMIALRYE